MNNEVSERGKGGVFHENFEKIYQDLPRRSWTDEVTHAWHVFTSVLNRRGTCSREYHIMLGLMWYHHVNDIIYYHIGPCPMWYVLMWLLRQAKLDVVSACTTLLIKWRGKILTLPRRAWPVPEVVSACTTLLIKWRGKILTTIPDVEGGDVKC